VTILLFALLVMALGFLSLSSLETRSSHKELQSQQAFWLAEAGKERALRWMTVQATPPSSDRVIYANQAGPDGGSYSVTVRVDTTAQYAAVKAFVLESVGTSGPAQRRIRERIKMTCFAQYAYFTDGEQSPGGETIWFYTNDVIQGLLHTNGTLHIRGNPTFQGRVTSASDRMIGYQNNIVTSPAGWPVAGNDPDFQQGFVLNNQNIPLPTQVLDLKSDAQTGGLWLPNASTVQFGWRGSGATAVQAPGWLRYRKTSDSWNTASAVTSVQISTLAKKVLYCNNDMEISGRLQGELTAASHQNITIVDDLVYQNSNASGAPLTGCTDLLGLVAENNIIFDYNTSVTPLPTQDLKVDAVLMALNTSITAENYTQGAPRGTLTIWGGLIQKYRGGVGQTDGTSITHGYAKDYHYDDRITGHSPPNFPLTGVYEVVSWSETWDASNPF
jgi:hypothetical protein